MLSDEQRLRICELAEAGQSVRQIAEQLGVNPSTVTRNAKLMGVAFDRESTRAATAARVADARARRAELAERLLDLANTELDRLNRPHRAFSFLSGQAPGYYERVLPQPDPASRLAFIRGASTLIDRHMRLAAMAPDDSTEDAKSMLGNLMEDLRLYRGAFENADAAERVPDEA